MSEVGAKIWKLNNMMKVRVSGIKEKETNVCRFKGGETMERKRARVQDERKIGGEKF